MGLFIMKIGTRKTTSCPDSYTCLYSNPKSSRCIGMLYSVDGNLRAAHCGFGHGIGAMWSYNGLGSGSESARVSAQGPAPPHSFSHSLSHSCVLANGQISNFFEDLKLIQNALKQLPWPAISTKVLESE